MLAFLFTGLLLVSAQRECQEEAERTSARAYLIESVESGWRESARALLSETEDV